MHSTAVLLRSLTLTLLALTVITRVTLFLVRLLLLLLHLLLLALRIEQQVPLRHLHFTAAHHADALIVTPVHPCSNE